MNSIKHSDLYSEVLMEFNYTFGDVFIFDGFVIGEIKEGVVFTYDQHAKMIIDDISCYLGSDGSDVVYISNRIHSYTVMAIDWLKFYKNGFNLKGYGVVNYNKSNLNALFESLFCISKIKKFRGIDEAVNWAGQSRLVLA